MSCRLRLLSPAAVMLRDAGCRQRSHALRASDGAPYWIPCVRVRSNRVALVTSFSRSPTDYRIQRSAGTGLRIAIDEIRKRDVPRTDTGAASVCRLTGGSADLLGAVVPSSDPHFGTSPMSRATF